MTLMLSGWSLVEISKISSTVLAARIRECFKIGFKPKVHRWDREGQNLWCIWWGGDYVQIVVKFEFARPMLERLWRKLGPPASA